MKHDRRWTHGVSHGHLAEDLTASELDRVRGAGDGRARREAELVRPDVGRLPDGAVLPVDVGRSAERIDCALFDRRRAGVGELVVVVRLKDHRARLVGPRARGRDRGHATPGVGSRAPVDVVGVVQRDRNVRPGVRQGWIERAQGLGQDVQLVATGDDALRVDVDGRAGAAPLEEEPIGVWLRGHRGDVAESNCVGPELVEDLRADGRRVLAAAEAERVTQHPDGIDIDLAGDRTVAIRSRDDSLDDSSRHGDDAARVRCVDLDVREGGAGVDHEGTETEVADEVDHRSMAGLAVDVAGGDPDRVIHRLIGVAVQVRVRVVPREDHRLVSGGDVRAARGGADAARHLRGDARRVGGGAAGRGVARRRGREGGNGQRERARHDQQRGDHSRPCDRSMPHVDHLRGMRAKGLESIWLLERQPWMVTRRSSVSSRTA